MALKLIEGFDHFSTVAKMAAKGWSLVGGATGTGSLPAGRIEGNCYQVVSTAGQNSQLVKSLPAAYGTVVIGFAFKFSALPTSTNDILLLRTVGGVSVGSVRLVTGTGQLRIVNGSGSTIATGATALSVGTWYFIELKIFVNGASGTGELMLNGVSEIASTTGNFGSTNIGQVLIQSGSSAATQQWDDMYLLDTSGSAPNNTFLGDVHVETLFPSADGAHTDFTPNSGSNHFDRVNDQAGTFPDDDTTYVSDATVGHRDSYAYDDLSVLTGTIFGVQTVQDARKDDAGTRQIAAVARVSGTDYDGATVTLGTTYAMGTEIRETNPNTSAAWTVSDVNGAEFGIKVVA